MRSQSSMLLTRSQKKIIHAITDAKQTVWIKKTPFELLLRKFLTKFECRLSHTELETFKRFYYLEKFNKNPNNILALISTMLYLCELSFRFLSLYGLSGEELDAISRNIAEKATNYILQALQYHVATKKPDDFVALIKKSLYLSLQAQSNQNVEGDSKHIAPLSLLLQRERIYDLYFKPMPSHFNLGKALKTSMLHLLSSGQEIPCFTIFFPITNSFCCNAGIQIDRKKALDLFNKITLAAIVPASMFPSIHLTKYTSLFTSNNFFPLIPALLILALWFSDLISSRSAIISSASIYALFGAIYNMTSKIGSLNLYTIKKNEHMEQKYFNQLLDSTLISTHSEIEIIILYALATTPLLGLFILWLKDYIPTIPALMGAAYYINFFPKLFKTIMNIVSTERENIQKKLTKMLDEFQAFEVIYNTPSTKTENNTASNHPFLFLSKSLTTTETKNRQNIAKLYKISKELKSISDTKEHKQKTNPAKTSSPLPEHHYRTTQNQIVVIDPGIIYLTKNRGDKHQLVEKFIKSARAGSLKFFPSKEGRSYKGTLLPYKLKPRGRCPQRLYVEEKKNGKYVARALSPTGGH